ncbi:hypothetical protein HCUR_01102 [Holospora curviuscula]|uniref:Uncharacterized protein n=1 Tax=Holospora curviuscula TaxID=1082868 RepID=A0A2S5R831_9PROT|nr:hypothetical protein HCUR_01102 [Holospora curviuscula]
MNRFLLKNNGTQCSLFQERLWEAMFEVHDSRDDVEFQTITHDCVTLAIDIVLDDFMFPKLDFTPTRK